LLVDTYRTLPSPNHLESIPGIGEVTAAVLTAKIISIERFERPEQLVNYFGVFPEEKSPGINPDGTLRSRSNTRMSKKGSDLVRHYLFTAALSASQHNPAVRALYTRLRSRGTTGKSAMGHLMRKLLHLTFAVWKSGKSFNPQHYPWEQAKEVKEAEGHKQDVSPDQQVVTPTSSDTLNRSASNVNSSTKGIDFQAVRSRTSMRQVLELLDFHPTEAHGDQLRGGCPVHGSTSPDSRSFSVHPGKSTYRCFKCGSQGNHLDLWVAVTHQEIYAAAIDLCHQLHMDVPYLSLRQSVPQTGEEEPVLHRPKRAGSSNKKPASSRQTPIDKSS